MKTSSTFSLSILAILTAVNTDGIKLFRSIKETVCLEIPALLANSVWLNPSQLLTLLPYFSFDHHLHLSIYTILVILTNIFVILLHIIVTLICIRIHIFGNLLISYLLIRHYM